jgi:hypothetical protein
MPLLPAGEWKPDVADYEGTAAHNILNVVPRGMDTGRFPSFAAYTRPCRPLAAARSTP